VEFTVLHVDAGDGVVARSNVALTSSRCVLPPLAPPACLSTTTGAGRKLLGEWRVCSRQAGSPRVKS
jgi:hypothetical protein